VDLSYATHLIPVLQRCFFNNFPTPSLLLCLLTPAVHFPFCKISLCKAFFSAFWSRCFAVGAWAAFTGTGILALSSPTHHFFRSTIFGKVKLCSSLPRSLHPPLGSQMRFSKQIFKGLSLGCLCTMQMSQGLSREIAAYIGTTEIYRFYIYIYL